MRRFTSLILLASLSLIACSEDKADRAGRGEKTKTPGTPVFRADGQLTSLTGLYESGAATAQSQLCIIEGKGKANFALVLRGQGNRSCSGGGTLSRTGERLTFTMAGESGCTFDAELKGREMVVGKALASGCSYYCTAGTSLSGARFTLTGPSIEDARRARDLVGEALCAS